MTRLAHNDFLQQGSDSGLPGLLAYATWLLGGIGVLAIRLHPKKDLATFGTVLGLTGIVAQAFLEFWLYIPAIAWPTFFLLGLTLVSNRPTPPHAKP